MPRITGLCRVSKDPELKTSGAGNEYATMRIAFTERNREAKKTVWATAKVFGKRAATFAKLEKGEMFFVDGDLEMSTTEDGKTFLDVLVDNFEFVYANKPEGKEASAPAAAKPKADAPAKERKPVNKQSSGAAESFDDDDIPF